MTSLLVVAGEASGDLHAARLLGELRKLRPELETFGLGGDELAAEGLDALAHSAEIAVVGITEVLSILPRAWKIYKMLLRAVDERRPDAAVLVDFPEFNLRLAKQLHRRGIPVVYYVSPQIWAWRRGRVRTIASRVERMLVLFPFELEFYRDAGVKAVHVGHPLVDEVPALTQLWEEQPELEGPLRLALLPGSRRSEVAALLPILLRGCRLLEQRLEVQPFLVRAPTVSREWLDAELAKLDLGPIEIVDSDRMEQIASSHLAWVASGTATLEVGLLRTPMLVGYRVGKGSEFLGRMLLDLPFISLVNLVLDREVVPEILQAQATPERFARETEKLLADPERLRSMRVSLGELRDALGAKGASRRAAEQVEDLLATRGAA